MYEVFVERGAIKVGSINTWIFTSCAEAFLHYRSQLYCARTCKSEVRDASKKSADRSRYLIFDVV